MIRLVLAVLALVGLATVGDAQESYRIQPGDTLRVEVLEDPQLNREVLVLPDGAISFPLAGTVRAGGRSVDAVADALSSELEEDFAIAPTVLVSVASLAPRTPARGPEIADLMSVYVLGEVNSPGRKEVAEGTTLLQFLAESGGLSRFAAEKRIQLRRIDRKTGEEKVYPFNYRTMGAGGGSISAATVLAPGDVVFVPERRLFE